MYCDACCVWKFARIHLTNKLDVCVWLCRDLVKLSSSDVNTEVLGQPDSENKGTHLQSKAVFTDLSWKTVNKCCKKCSLSTSFIIYERIINSLQINALTWVTRRAICDAFSALLAWGTFVHLNVTLTSTPFPSILIDNNPTLTLHAYCKVKTLMYYATA